eukprot:4106498-Prymnesium_polylepis.1
MSSCQLKGPAASQGPRNPIHSIRFTETLPGILPGACIYQLSFTKFAQRTLTQLSIGTESSR